MIIVKETYSRERVCQNKTDTGFSHYRRPALEKALEIMFNNTDEERSNIRPSSLSKKVIEPGKKHNSELAHIKYYMAYCHQCLFGWR